MRLPAISTTVWGSPRDYTEAPNRARRWKGREGLLRRGVRCRYRYREARATGWLAGDGGTGLRGGGAGLRVDFAAYGRPDRCRIARLVRFPSCPPVRDRRLDRGVCDGRTGGGACHAPAYSWRLSKTGVFGGSKGVHVLYVLFMLFRTLIASASLQHGFKAQGASSNSNSTL